MRVERIGADGDGIATTERGTKLFLANTLPGEVVRPGALIKRGEGYAADAEILEPSPERVASPCPHFGPCGGCTLQHWSDVSYAEWKLSRAGVAAGLRPSALERTPPGARRRIDLAIRREGAAVRIGLHRRRSTEIVDMRACPILHPKLFGLVQELRPTLARLAGLRREGSALVNLLDSGPDLLLRTDAELTAADRALLAGFAQHHGVPRISWARARTVGTEPAAALRPATTAFAGWSTEIPPGGFLQASCEGEQAIVASVVAALPARLRGGIVELFAGCGTLTNALSAHGRVTAYEGDASAVSAQRRAGNPRVAAVMRDLARQPLTAAEFKGAGVIVLDPPYAGAAPQMPALALTGVPIVYVSCNPAALARDAKPLFLAGYRPRTVAAIDQFLWSAQVEIVVAFARDARSEAGRT